MPSSVKIGLLAMQGAFKKHGEIINSLGHETLEVRNPSDLDSIHGLVIPGGESTTIYKLLQKSGLFDSVKEKIQKGMPVFGTCAGIILLAKTIKDMDQPRLGVLDVTVERNAYGRQVESFEAPLHVKGFTDPMPGIFIRAPKIIETGTDVEVLAEFENVPVLVRQNRILAATFHPELTCDTRIHELFINSLSQA